MMKNPTTRNQIKHYRIVVINHLEVTRRYHPFFRILIELISKDFHL